MSKPIYIRRSKRDIEIRRTPWDISQGTKEEWEQENRIIQDTEDLHFLYDNEDDATELHDFIYEKLHLSSNFWDVVRDEYRQILEKFGTPIGIELSILYFAIKRSWSGDYDNDDTGIPMKAWEDVGIFGDPKESQYWREGLKEIDESDLRDALHDLPLQPELCLEVYIFFLFQFSRHTFDSFNSKVRTKHEIKRVFAWFTYLKKLSNSVKKVISASAFKTKTIDLNNPSKLRPVEKWSATDKGRFLSQIYPDISPPDLARAYCEKLDVKFLTLKRTIHKERNNDKNNIDDKRVLTDSKMDSDDAKAALRIFLNVK